MGWTCLISQGIKVAVKNNPNLFPHGFIQAYTQGRAIFIVDKKVNRPHPGCLHSVHYLTNHTELTDMFDDKNVTLAMVEKKFGKMFTVHLRPAVKRGGDEAPHARDTRRRAPNINSRKEQKQQTRNLSGAMRRFALAGLIAPPTDTNPEERLAKNTEDRVRRMANRRNLKLVKKRSRNKEAPDYGLFAVVGTDDVAVNPPLSTGSIYSWTLENAEAYFVASEQQAAE